MLCDYGASFKCDWLKAARRSHYSYHGSVLQSVVRNFGGLIRDDILFCLLPSADTQLNTNATVFPRLDLYIQTFAN